MSAVELAAAIRRKKVSPVEVVDAVLSRIERLNPTLNAYCTVTVERARRAAKAAERALTRKGARLGPLHGVPFSVKDLIITKGVRTTWGTRLHAEHVPDEDAPVVERLKAAGVFTESVDTAMKFARELETGNIHINWGPQWRADLMPYGGLKDSGFGKEGPRYAVEEMTELKMVVFHLKS